MEKIIKHGKNIAGTQIYLNKETGKVFVKDEDRKDIPLLVKNLAVKMYIEEGISYRKVGRILNVSHVSVMNWVIAEAKKVKFETTFKGHSVDEVEIDEIYAIVEKKSPDNIINMCI
jgi:transposase-like protein